jgi:hypothetical protein
MSEEKFIFTGAIKKRIFAMMAVGAVLLLFGIWLTSKGVGEAGHGHHDEVTSKEVTKVEGKTDVEKTEKVEKTEAHGEGHHGKPVWVIRLLKNLWHNNVFFSGIVYRNRDCWIVFRGI